MARKRFTTRRLIIQTVLGLGATGMLHATLDSGAWRAYESLEESWIRDRSMLLAKQSPNAAAAAKIDAELKLAELHRRALQFKHLTKTDPRQLRGGVWQLSWLPFTDREKTDLEASDPAYRRQEQKIRALSESLRKHPEYESFRKAQTRLWKTPQYKEIHRKYSGRMQELQKIYGGSNYASF
jgi:hypothetical protein